MKHLCIIILFSMLRNCNMETININSKNYTFFPLRCDYIKFSMRAYNKIHIAMTQMEKFAVPYYNVVIGDWNKTFNVLFKDTNKYYRSIYIDNNQAHDDSRVYIWIKMDDIEQAITVGKVNMVQPFLHFLDPDYNEMRYFGFLSGKDELEIDVDFDGMSANCKNKFRKASLKEVRLPIEYNLRGLNIITNKMKMVKEHKKAEKKS